MRTLQFLFLSILPSFLLANMASPVQEGTLAGSPFISQYVDITHENILITPDDNFGTAQFKIEYHINATKAGMQVPLLFYASEYKDSFRVWIDGREVVLSKIPATYQNINHLVYADFDFLFDGEGQIDLDYSGNSLRRISTNNLKFFELDLAKGAHIIKVEYIAENWTDRSDWVIKTSFKYLLSPAKFWKSFGTLNITLDASKFKSELKVNELGKPTRGDLNSVAVWTFDHLPVDMLHISYQPELNNFAKTLIALSPSGMAYILAIFLVLVQLLFMYYFRRKNYDKKYSWPVIIGSILFPFLCLLFYMYGFTLIDSIIGESASKYHGYTFLVMIFYPIIMPLYWLLMWLVDRYLVRRFR